MHEQALSPVQKSPTQNVIVEKSHEWPKDDIRNAEAHASLVYDHSRAKG